MANKKTPFIYLVAGEASGDLIGASLMQALVHQTSGRITFAGIGGHSMESQGLRSLFPLQELSIMGIAEVIPHIPNVLNRLAQTTRHIIQHKPDVVVTIDSPGFNFRLARNLQASGIPLIHYIAPTVWAWRPWRAQKIAKLYQHLLTVFAFEPPYFEKHGLASTFVGHPLIEKNIHTLNPYLFRQQHQLDADHPLLCVLPGSRQSELRQLLPIFGQTLSLLKKQYPTLKIVVPTLPQLAEYITTTLVHYGISPLIVTDETDKYSAMRACTAALAASGTVTLELALAQAPMVVAYKINKLTEWIIRPLLQTPYVALPNILAGKPIVHECLQAACTPQNLFTATHQLLKNPHDNQHQRQALQHIQQYVHNPTAPPKELAAAVVLKYSQKK